MCVMTVVPRWETRGENTGGGLWGPRGPHTQCPFLGSQTSYGMKDRFSFGMVSKPDAWECFFQNL